MRDTHRYRGRVSWSGSTAMGYDAYDRSHVAQAEPAAAALTLSADPAFRGDSAQLNPEQLLLLAASSCQLLSFLAVAARARVDVVAYEDSAEATMPPEPRPQRITEIVLRPRITVRGDVATDRVERLAVVAHEECFISNSLASEVRLDVVVVRA